MTPRDCVFIVADRRIKHVLQAFFGKNEWQLTLNCAPFSLDLERDIIALEGHNDPGTYVRGHEVMREYLGKYNHAFVILDEAWENSPGKVCIVEELTQRIVHSGWRESAFKVIVIQPELENWIWIDSSHVDEALGMPNGLQARSWLEENGLWNTGEDKPTDPKLAYERIIRFLKKSDSPSIYKKIVSRASLKKCTDPAFGEIKETLRIWFPLQ